MKNDNFNYLLPFNSELAAIELIPFRASKELEGLAVELFSHPYNKYNKIAYRYFKSHKHLGQNMCKVAIGSIRYYNKYPQQFGGAMENIYATVIVRMHMQLVKCMIHDKSEDMNKYMAAKLSLIKVSTRFFDQLISDIQHINYIQSDDQLIKKRKGIGKRERYMIKESVLNYYDTLT